MCSLSKQQSILSRETIQMHFFQSLHLFRLTFFILYQAPNSRALAPACGTLVFLNNKTFIYEPHVVFLTGWFQLYWYSVIFYPLSSTTQPCVGTSMHHSCFNPFPNKPWFLRVYSTCLSKTLWEKEKLLITSNFSFFHSVFYPFGELSAIFFQFEIVACKLFQFGRV